MRYFAGIDGGATKTVCVVGDSEGRCLGKGMGGPSNYHNVGLKGAVSAVTRAVRDAERSAGSKPSVACAGLAGLDTPNDEKVVSRGFAGRSLARRFVVVHDSLVALTGAFAGGPGVVVIAGTGSVVGALDEHGRHFRVGGWGPTIGDEGSAYDIARRGLAAAMRSYDGRGRETTLLEKFMRRLGARAPEGVMDALYGEGMSVAALASLAPLVTEAADQGDEVSRRILTEVGGALGEMVVAAAERAGMDDFAVAPAGGVFESGAFVLEAMDARMRSGSLNPRLAVPRFPPHIGALMMAMRLGGVEMTGPVLENLESSRGD